MRNLLAQGRIGWQEWFWMICLYHMGMHKKTAPYDTNVNTSYNDGGAQSYGADSDYKVKVLIHFSQELDPKNSKKDSIKMAKTDSKSNNKVSTKKDSQKRKSIAKK